MKLKKSMFKNAETLYLYSTGELIIVHSKRIKETGENYKFATFIEKVDFSTNFEGRIVFPSPGYYPLLMEAMSINASKLSSNNGSDKSRGLGVKSGYVNFYMPYGYVHTIQTDIIAGDLYAMDSELNYDKETIYEFGDIRIAKFYWED